jgi:hypothetical protein
MANPTSSLPLEGYTQYKIRQFGRRANGLRARADAARLHDYHEKMSQTAGQLAEQNLGIHERIGSFLDTAPLLGGVKKGTTTALGVAGSILGAPGRALPGGIMAVQEGRNFFEGAFEGIMDRRPDVNYASVLENAGMETPWARNVLGFALDIALDPLNIFILRSVQTATGKILRRAAEPVERVPGVTKAVTTVQRPFAHLFSPRLGFGQAGETYWHINQLAKAGEITREGAEKTILYDRRLKNYVRSSDELAVEEVVEGLREQHFNDLIGEGLDESTAKIRASEWVDSLKNQDDFNKALSKRMYDWQREGSEKSWDEAALRAEELGTTQFGIHGASSIVRYLKSQFAKDIGEGKGVTPGEIARLRNENLGTTLTEGFYMPAHFRRHDVTRAVQNSDVLQQRFFTPSIRRKDLTDDYVHKHLEPNIILRIASSIASTRVNAYAHELISDELLAKIGTKATLPEDLLALRQQELLVRFSSDTISEMQQLLAKEVSTEEIAEQFARKYQGPGGETLYEGSQIVKVAGKEATEWVDDVTLIRQVLDHTETATRKLFNPNPRNLIFDKSPEGIAQRDKVNKDLVSAGIIPDPKKRTPYMLPRELAESFEKYHEPLQMTGFLRAIDGLNSMWKPLVTTSIWNVSFFSRNEVGLGQMLSLAGMRPDEIGLYGARSAGFMKRGMANGTEPYSIHLKNEGIARWKQRGDTAPTEYKRHELHRAWVENGGLSVGQRNVSVIDPFTNQPLNLLQRVGARMTGRKIPTGTQQFRIMNEMLAKYGENAFKRYGANPFALGTSLNEGLDNHARIALMLWRMEKGDTAAEAARVSAKYIGDYTELGRFTEQIAPVVPFVRWIRFNTPLQVEGLIRRPHVGSKVGLLRGDEADQESMKAEMDTLPDWILERHHVLLGKGEDGRLRLLTGLGLPLEDLNRLFALNPSNTFQNALPDITPFLRAPLEGLINHSFFTGEAISDKDKSWNFYNRAWGWTAAVPGLRNWLELQQFETKDGRTLYKADPMNMFVFSSILSRPGYEADRIGRIAENRADSPLHAINFLTGAKFRNIFPTPPSRVEFTDVINQNPKFAAIYRGLQDIPLYPEFGVEGSARVARMINRIHAVKRAMAATYGRDVHFLEAADRLGEEDDAVGMAIMVHQSRLRPKGKQARAMYRRENPVIDVVRAGLPVEVYETIFDIAVTYDAT